ncbi:MAG: methyltransferase domain-containing protein [Lentimicrobiaceae bacterium]|jgi:2-polyprenyl-3-methyl-5-hydroxy-6-metoxy-1,4-benzoquinol methylase|nr:methyltransferase domain-containing protein [Candidatus Scalindua sp.]MBT6671624.1 methyltransferase domain-containing protein [Lentimicrobiaceae bacterium]
MDNIMSLDCCRLCHCELFPEPIMQLNGMPKAAQYYPTKEEFVEDKGINLEIFQCSACGLVQLNIGPVEYYKEVITAASFSEKTRLSRLQQMQGFVEKFELHGKKVIEVGSGKGNMLEILEEAGLKSFGIEASSESVAIGQSAGRNMINGFLEDIDIISDGPFDAFVSLNYLEHLPGPGEIIQSIYRNTTSNAVGYVTVPNLDYLLKAKCFYEFVADHLSYFTQSTLRYTFEKNGFDVLECCTINEDNDIAAIVKKKEILDISEQFSEVKELIRNLQQIVAGYKSQNKKVAVWGAGHRTLALLALSKLDNIQYVVDSAKFKQGRFTPVLHLNIVSPEHLKEEHVDLVIVMVPGLYPGEVLKTLKQMNVGVDIAILRGNQIDFM